MTSIKAGLFFLVAPGTVCGLVPWLLSRWTAMDFPSGRIPGVVLIVLGAAGLLWCFFDFVRQGRGTPNPYDPPKALVTAGLYRVSRNPMYVAIVLALVGEGLWFERPVLFAWAVTVWLVFHVRVLEHEEPALERLFGEDWRRYRDSVRRWL